MIMTIICSFTCCLFIKKINFYFSSSLNIILILLITSKQYGGSQSLSHSHVFGPIHVPCPLQLNTSTHVYSSHFSPVHPEKHLHTSGLTQSPYILYLFLLF